MQSNSQNRPDEPQPTGSTYDSWKRDKNVAIAAGLFLTLLGVLIATANFLEPVPPKDAYRRVSANYVKQDTLNQLWAPQLQVEVRFLTSDRTLVTAFIHPNDSILSLKHKSLPVLYETRDPKIAFYAGRGGDSDLITSSSARSSAIVGAFIAVLGVLLFVPMIIQRRRIFTLARRVGQGRIVRVRWKEGSKRELPTVIVDDPAQHSDYSWSIYREKEGESKLKRLLLGTSRRRAATSAVVSLPDYAELGGELGPHQWIVLRAAGGLILPESRAEPVIGSSPASLPFKSAELDPLIHTHRMLLAAYAGVCNQARVLPRFVRPPTESDAIVWLPRFRTLLCTRAMIRVHVDQHIHRQLRQLSGAYLRTEMLISGTSNELTEQRRRLSDLREECEQFSVSLSDIRRRVSAFVLGVAALLPLVPALVKIRAVPLTHLLGMLLTVATYALLFLPGIFALLAYTDTFRCKRRLFLSYRAPGAQIPEYVHQNIYRLETMIFDLLNQPKVSERMSDCWANVIVLVVGTVLVIRQIFFPAAPISIGIIQEVTAYVGLIVIIVFLARATVVNLFRRQRQER